MLFYEFTWRKRQKSWADKIRAHNWKFAYSLRSLIIVRRTNSHSTSSCSSIKIKIDFIAVEKCDFNFFLSIKKKTYSAPMRLLIVIHGILIWCETFASAQSINSSSLRDWSKFYLWSNPSQWNKHHNNHSFAMISSETV